MNLSEKLGLIGSSFLLFIGIISTLYGFKVFRSIPSNPFDIAYFSNDTYILGLSGGIAIISSLFTFSSILIYNKMGKIGSLLLLIIGFFSICLSFIPLGQVDYYKVPMLGFPEVYSCTIYASTTFFFIPNILIISSGCIGLLHEDRYSFLKDVLFEINSKSNFSPKAVLG